MNFTEQQQRQIQAHGLQTELIKKQIQQFETGVPYTKVLAAATSGNGIDSIDKQNQLVELYESKKEQLDIVKFVPASGAATRMFKCLYTFINDNRESNDVKKFHSQLHKLPFADILIQTVKTKYPEFENFDSKEQTKALIKTLLTTEGLGYGELPKGLIPFHRYQNRVVTPFEEQLLEAPHYASSKGICKLHFTVSEEHLDGFKNAFKNLQSSLEAKTKCTFDVSYSFQKKETDTIAVNIDNTPYVDPQGNLVFRPSGHGALIENLNDINADIIFIKNIDNVVLENHLEKLALHKKILAGKLLSIQERVFSFLKQLESDRVSSDTLDEIKEFIVTTLHLQQVPQTASELKSFLNRPIRVCGMVKNTGAPGGGPFWVIDEHGVVSKQIVELSQIDTTHPHQQSIVEKATHFNPVDLVCGVKNHNGEKFDLTKFVDPKAGFISEKSINGTPVKALELPGLWNGAMANWITVFVEVPLYTFNPVKTVLDLLKESHQAKEL